MVYWKEGKSLNNGKYIVNEILGSGGFGVTYKITEAKTNRLFALKTLNTEAQSRPDFDQLQTKFINEAIALASCPHPNIVHVYPQVFQEEGLWCMVMEYVEGEDLGRYIEKNGKLSESKAIAIIIKVGEALSSIHQKGFLHRDIKPANILLRQSDLSPVLIDFGLAREFISETTISVFVVWWRVLFYTRTGEWEFVGRVLGESRPVSVMLVTASENKTESGSLVSS